MTKKEQKKLKKEKRQRKKYDALKRKEYSKKYLQKLDKRNSVPHSYPKARLVLLWDFLKSKDLHKAIGLFLGSQISIFLLLFGVDYPGYAPVIGIMSIAIGLLCVILSIREINRRQSKDVSRKPVRFKLVFKTVILALLATTIIPMFLTKFGVSSGGPAIQPNQEMVDSTLALFPLPMIFTTIIVAPFIEEIIFRELLPYATGPSYLSFILTSLLFIIVHSPNGVIGWISYGIASIGFLSVRLINNNVYSSIAVHFIWNVMSLIL